MHLSLKQKETIYMILFVIINTFLSFIITKSLGIYNVVIYKSYVLYYSEITWEVVIFIAISILVAGIYDYYDNRIENLSNMIR